MSHYIINTWKEFHSYVSDNRNFIDRIALLDLLKVMSEKFKQSKENSTQQLHADYLSYYEALDFSNYYDCEDTWYSLKDLVKYDILNSKIDEPKRPIVKVRDLLWELLAFRSDRACPVCEMDMRVLSPKKSEELHFSCDNCGTTCYINGNRIVVEETHYPALYNRIKKAGIEPGMP